MAQRPFRFVHSSDWELQRPLLGWADAPEALPPRLLSAPFDAAAAVVETAIREQVDFLLLTGGLAPLEEADAGTIQFLAAQFERLAQERIDVYWVGGPNDPPAAWPPGLSLPGTVQTFPVGEAVEQVVRVEQTPVARLVGASARSKGVDWSALAGASGGLPTIAAAWGRPRPDDLPSDVSYWALGGRSRFSGEQTKSPLRYCGSPQGRCPAEEGPHGCAIVQVAASGEFKVRFAATDVVRYRKLHLELGDQATVQQLEAQLRESLRTLRGETPEIDQLVHVEVSAGEALTATLRRSGAALAASATRDLGGASPGVWCLAVEAATKTEWPESLRSQQTMLGDYLRLVAGAQEEDEPPFDLLAEAKDLSPAGFDEGRISLADRRQRRRVLARAAALGVDLLQSEDAAS